VIQIIPGIVSKCLCAAGDDGAWLGARDPAPDREAQGGDQEVEVGGAGRGVGGRRTCCAALHQDDRGFARPARQRKRGCVCTGT